VLVSSHVLSEVEQTVDDVLVLSAGRLVRAGSVDALRAEAGTATHVVSPDATRLAEVLADEGHGVRPGPDGGLLVDAPPERVGELAAAHGLVLHRLAERGTALEDVFLQLTAPAPSPEQASA
jgi:ABC-2 type transport system ATP-binding protein